MSDALKKLLTKPKPTSSTAPLEESKSAAKRTMTLSDGTEVEFEPLKEDEKQSVRRAYLRRGKDQKRYVRTDKKLPSAYVAPDYVRKALSADAGLTEKQRRYKNDVVDMETLKKPSPDVVKNNNRQKLDRYVLWTEMRACKNGFVYYTLPFCVSLVFFFVSLSFHDFWVNALFSTLVLLDFLALRYIFKEVPRPIHKALLTVLLVGANVGIYFIAIQVPDFLAGLDLVFALRMLLIIFSVYHFGKFYVKFAEMYAQDCKLDFGNTVQIKAGKPRCGKTSSAVQDGIILAKMKWQELLYDYWELSSREKEIIASNDKEKLLELEEIRLALNFYIMRPCIPCLWSNIGIFDKTGRACHKITLEHVKGLSRLPVYSVVILDEIGAMLKADDGLNKSGIEKPLDISDMFRLGGHFVKWVVIGCEQDFNHIYIDFRRVVGFNQVIQGQEWICRPQLAYLMYKALKFLRVDGLDKKIKKKPKYARFMKSFKTFVYSIGFRKIKYGYASNTETDAGLAASDSDTQLVKLSGEKTRLCPSNLAADYDDRAYKQKYPSYFDKIIRGELHKHKYIETTDKNTAAFVNETAALLEKREAQKGKIREVA